MSPDMRGIPLDEPHGDSAASPCTYDCCDSANARTTDSFHVMYPGEFDRAVGDGWDLSRVRKVSDDADGGIRFVTTDGRCCPAADAAQSTSGSGTYRSFECRAYPLWPYLHNQEWRFRISARCPVHSPDVNLADKVDAILDEVRELARDATVMRWFQHQRPAWKFKEYPTRHDKPREAVILPPDISRSSVLYPITVNGRLIRYGIREGENAQISPGITPVISDLVLACAVVELADCEYINVYRPVSPVLLDHLNQMLLEASEGTRTQLGAPMPALRVPVVTEGKQAAAPSVTAVIRASGSMRTGPTVQIVNAHSSYDGAPLNKYVNEFGDVRMGDTTAMLMTVARIVEALTARDSRVTVSAGSDALRRAYRHLEAITRAGLGKEFSILAQ
ncbi:MAG: hypothetical protein ABJE47_09805 [bacterium]